MISIELKIKYKQQKTFAKLQLAGVVLEKFER